MDIISIFESIDGEVNAFHSGRLTTFIRLAKCNLRCEYCDTTYSFGKGLPWTLQEILAKVNEFKAKKVTITGGEPLLQKEAVCKLIYALLEIDYKISIETNGSIALPRHLLQHPSVSWIVDYKLPSSGMEDKMNADAFIGLGSKDYIKFLIKDKADFIAASEARKKLESPIPTNFAYSPVFGAIKPEELVDMLATYGRGDEILNIQLHKMIWPDCCEDNEK